MPLYEYKCEKCGDVFEVRQKFSDEPLTAHEKCGGSVHRLLSAPALQFKGSGWYVNDYAKSGSNGPAKSETNSGEKAASSTKKDSSATTSSEKSSPPAAASETKSS